ncbi:MFS DHA1 sub-family [Lactarius pseudohatsudake]|nr:MFS DHA1 sub-family [Lactarius pseudohatsudake]
MAKVENIVFLSLVLDLFAFTIPLPLFPRIIEWYTQRESSDPHGFLSRTLWAVSTIRGWFYNPSNNTQRWDVVLLGGLMGSVFSTLQFIVSPYIGSLSDKYGRKKILLLSMIGNILSALVWIKSTTFASYMLSRVIGGLSEGNVQLAIAILSDITTPANRAKALAHVGIAFAICFCIGPPIGAYFASRPVELGQYLLGTELNVYAAPAILTLLLLVAETAFLAVALPETRGKKPTVQSSKKTDEHSTEFKTNGTNGTNGVHTKKDEGVSPVRSAEQRLRTLRSLRLLHFLFLGVFSGVEFTLTFLTFDLLDWSNAQNGKLIGSIGIVSAVIQGGYVRRALTRLSLLPQFTLSKPGLAFRLLQIAAVCMAFTSATVVNALTAHASLQCDEAPPEIAAETTGNGSTPPPRAVQRPELAKGQALGRFRSSGQLGRAIGPLFGKHAYGSFVSCADGWLIQHVRLTGLSGPLSRTQLVRLPWLDSPPLCTRLRVERL